MFPTRQTLALLALLGAGGPPTGKILPGGEAPVGAELVRGMTISCQTWGWEWGTDGFARELDELRALGVNWIAIHPYATVRADGALRWRPIDPDEPPEWLARPLAEARARGLSLLVKPHLAYWGSPFSWRGEIRFDDPERHARFWSDYRRWILELVDVTAEADGFVLGTELDLLLDDEPRWRELIAEVRARTDARLTYAANWTDYRRVPFWDALDAVGVQAYFPLVEGRGAELPEREALLAGWEPVLAALREVHERTGKPVVFTELGYNVSLDAARRPWEHATERGAELERARALQRRCLEVALEVLGRERSWLRGAFLWKWFVGETRSENFLVDTGRLRAVLREAWVDADRD